MEEERTSSVVDLLNGISEKPLEEVTEPESDTTEIENTEEQEVEEEVEDKEKSESKLPFHKDQKVQRYIEKQIEKELKDRLKDIDTNKPRSEDKGDINLPDSFVELIGNDTPEKVRVLKDLSAYLSSLPEKAKQQFMEEQAAVAKAQEEEDVRKQEELETYFEEIEETYGVDISSNSPSARKTRSEFIEYVRKIAPKNSVGEVTAFPDLIAAFDEFKDKRKSLQASRAKQLASRGVERTTEATAPAPAGRSWRDVDRYFATLKSKIK